MLYWWCESDGDGAPERNGSTVEFCRLRELMLMPAASRARSTEACDVGSPLGGRPDPGVVVLERELRALRLEEERCRPS